MISRQNTVIVGVAVLVGQALGEDYAQSTAELAGGCADILQDTTLCTEGGHCDCAAYVEAYPCGQLADIAVDDIKINADRSRRCERHQLITDLTRIAARVGEPMVGNCNILEDAIERTGEPPVDNKVSCGCLALIPEDEMPGMMNCMINEKFHGWQAHNLCKTLVPAGRRRAAEPAYSSSSSSSSEEDDDAEIQRRMSFTVEEAERFVKADPELFAAYEALEDVHTERRRQFVRDATWKGVLTSGSLYHTNITDFTMPGDETYEAWQSGVCNATCGLCAAPAAPSPIADMPTMIDGAKNLVDTAVNMGANADDDDNMVTNMIEVVNKAARRKARKKANKARLAAMEAGNLANANNPMRRLYETIRNLIQ